MDVEAAATSSEVVLPALSLGEISCKLLKDTVSNFRGGIPYAEAIAQTILTSAPSQGYVHCFESLAV